MLASSTGWWPAWPVWPAQFTGLARVPFGAESEEESGNHMIVLGVDP